jgi:hypothetical protein
MKLKFEQALFAGNIKTSAWEWKPWALKKA